jgi:hypothetical protein
MTCYGNDLRANLTESITLPLGEEQSLKRLFTELPIGYEAQKKLDWLSKTDYR